MGFCQCEPNVLKLTPPLTVTHEEIRAVCATIGEVLRRPLYRLLVTALGGWMKLAMRRQNHDNSKRSVGATHEPVSH
jgi:hypothetical protein